MKNGLKQSAMLVLALGVILLFVIGVAEHVNAYQVTLSLYNQGFDINAFYNDGDFDVEAGIVEADPSSLLVIVGDPANVEETLEIPEIPDPFALAEAGSDFHFEIAQPFRFQDRFDGLFSTTVDDPVLFVPDNGTVTAFRDDGLLADDRINLSDYEAELPPMYVEVDYGDTITMTTEDGTKLFITRIWRNSDFTVTFDISDVPEPGTLLLMGLGLLGLLGMAWKKGKKMNVRRIFPFSMLLVSIVLLIVAAFPLDAYAQDMLAMWGMYSTYKEQLGNCVQQDGPAGVFLKCDNGSVEWNNGRAIAVWGTIYDKWASLNWGWSHLGQPINNEVNAPQSPYGTTGTVQAFEGGYIYLHKSGPYSGKAFETHGAISNVHALPDHEGGTGGRLGFPVTDEIASGPFGYGISYFEGDHCITSLDGIEYETFEYCRKGQAPAPPKVVDAEGPGCIKRKNLSTELSVTQFIPIFSPYTPLNYTVELAPQSVMMPWDNLLITQNSDVIVSTKEFEGDGLVVVTMVNEDIKKSFSWNPPFDIGDLRFQRISKVISKFKQRKEDFDTITEVLKKWKTLPGPDPSTGTGWGSSIDINIDETLFNMEYSELCCAPSVTPKYSGKFQMGIDSSITFYTNRFYFYGMVFRGTAQAQLDIHPFAELNTTCSDGNVCIFPNVNFDGGIGLSAAVLDPVIARVDVLGGLGASTEDTNVCFDLIEERWTPWKIKICAVPKVWGEAELFSFIKKEFPVVKLGSLKFCGVRDAGDWRFCRGGECD